MLLAGTPSSGQAATRTWVGGTVGFEHDWATAANWGGTVPVAGDLVLINTTAAGTYPVISTGSQLSGDFYLGANNGTSTLDITNGTLTANIQNVNFVIGPDASSVSTLNLANTAVTGQANLTTFGQGSGNITTLNFKDVVIGRTAGAKGTLNMNTTGALTIAGSLQLGQSATGTLNQDGGSTTSAFDYLIGVNAGSFGTNNLGGGTVTVSRKVRIGQSGTGVLAQTGGIFTAGSQFTQVGANSGSTGLLNVSGGTNNLSATGVIVGDGGTGTLTVSGTGLVNLGSVNNLVVGGAATGTGTVNLNGGTIQAKGVSKNLGTANFNFNGGTLKAATNNGTFMTGLTSANVLGGGATIDTAGFDVSIGQQLLDGGAGGGLTKNGNGTLTLSGGYTYTGPTVIKGGTLALDAAQSSSASALTASNVTVTVSLNNGSSTLNAGNITLAGTNLISLNYGTANSPAWAINANGYTVSATGTNTIKITGSSLVVGQYPLIYTGSSVPTNSFVLAPLPTGVIAVLTNSGVSLDLLVTASGQNLTWYGADNLGNPLTTWNINTSSNWNTGNAKYLQYSGNSYGDNVTFDDSVYPGSTTVTLNTRVVPSTIQFNGSQAYSVTGTGGIDGVAGLNLNGGSLVLGTSNNYTGGTSIGATATLTITNDNALGGISSAVTLAGGTLQFGDSMVGARNLSVVSNSTIDVSAVAIAQLNGAFAGTGSLTKTGNGTLSFGVTSNSIGSKVIVKAGAVSFASGSTTLSSSPSSMSIGLDTGSGTVSMSSSGTLTALGNVYVGDSDAVGLGYDATGTLNISSGTTIFGGPGGNTPHTGAGGLTIGAAQHFQNAVSGTVTVSGGTVWCTNDVVTGFAGTGSGTLNISGSGTVNVGPAALKWLVLGKWDTSGGNLNISGGNLNLMNNSSIKFSAGNAAASGINTITQTGGTVAFYSDAGTTMGGTGDLNLAQSGSATANNTYNLDGGTLIVPQIGSASIAPTRTFNFNGGTLKAASANANFMNLGTGNAVANVRNGGAILNDNGYAVTIAQALMHSTIGGDNVTDGGLTKNGNGTLTLTGANTYTGPTTINAGELFVTPAHQTAGGVTVVDNAKFGISTSSTTNSANIGALMLGASGATTLDVSYGISGNPTNVALTAGAVTINGSSSLRIAGAFSIGSFPVLKYTSLTGSFSSVAAPRGTTVSVSNDVPNKTLYVVVSAVGGGITWSGSIGLIPNLWDINITTNWLTGSTPTTYLETVPPGDAVVFNDSGSGTVLVSNTVSPANVTINNSSMNYTFNGSGQINSTLGLTKLGSGTVTLNVPSTFSGSTVVSNGVLSLGTNITVGNLTGNGLITNASGTLALAVNNSANTTFSGSIAGGINLTMNGNGSLALTGTNNLLTGGLTVAAGSLNVSTGNTTLGTSISRIGYLTGTGAVSVAGSGVLTSLGNVWVGGSTINGTPYNASGTLNISGGSTCFGGPGGNTPHFGDGSLAIAASQNNQNSCSGTMSVSGGTVWCTNDLIDGFSGTGTGTLNISGTGTLNVGPAATKWLFLGKWDTVNGNLNISGGNLNLMNGSSIKFSGGNTVTSSTNVMTQSGGTVAFYSDAGTTLGGSGNIDLALNGATAANNTYNLNGGTLIVPQIIASSINPVVTFNFNGGVLKAAVSTGNFLNLGTGNAVANVRDNGAIIDSGSFNVSIPQSLAHSTIGGDNSTDGGLTKLGAGILYLDGANFYTGNTVVSNGVLAGIGSIASPVLVKSDGAIGAGDAGALGTLTVNNDVTIQSGAKLRINKNGGSPTSDLVNATGAVNYGGTLVVSNTTSDATALTPGDTFTLFSATTHNGNFTSIVSAGSGGAVYAFTNGVLTVVSVGPDVTQNHLTNSITGGGTILSLSWSPGWKLQVQTNSLTTGLSGNWVTITDGTVTSTNLPIAPGNPSVFYRLISQ